LGHLSLAIAGFAVALLLGRELGPAAYGVWGIVYAILVGVEQIGRLGIPQATSRLVAEADGRDPLLERRAVTLVLLVYTTLFAGLWFGAPSLERIFDIPDGTRLLRIAALDVPPVGLFLILLAVLNGRRDFAAEGIVVIVYAATRVLGLLVAAPFGLTVEVALVVTILSAVAASFAAAIRLGPGILRPRFDRLQPILAIAAPAALAWGAGAALSNLDLWALNAFGDDVAAEVKGWYTAALNLARVPNLLAFVATSILVPTMAHALRGGDRAGAQAALAGGTRMMSIVLVPVAVLGGIEARGLMELVFGAAYGDGAPLLAVLFLAHGVGYTAMMSLGAVLLAAGHERLSAVLAPAAVAIALVLLPLGTSFFGGMGTAVGSLVTALTGLALAARAVVGRVGPLGEPSLLPRILLSVAPVAIFALAVPSRGAWLLLELAVAGGLYLALLVVTDVLRSTDLAALRPTPTPASIAAAVDERASGR
jgi:PST family polysaccharide transporter